VQNDIAMEGLYLFGGQLADSKAAGELYIMELGKLNLHWKKGSEICKGKAPEPRYDHTMTRVRHRLIVMGGMNLKKDTHQANCFVEQVGALNLETMSWMTIKVFGDELLRRSEHSTALLPNNQTIYIFGGIDINFGLYTSIQKLDLTYVHKDEPKIKSKLFGKMRGLTPKEPQFPRKNTKVLSFVK